MVLIVLIILGAIFAIVVVLTNNPRSSLTSFLKAVQAQDAAKAQTYVKNGISAQKQNNIEGFIDDWTSGDSVTTVVDVDEAWRTRATAEKNKDGSEKEEIKPTPRYWAHWYQAEVTVTFDDIKDEVVVKMERNTDSTWSKISQLFKPWKIVAIKYPSIKKNNESYEDITDEVEVINDNTNESDTNENSNTNADGTTEANSNSSNSNENTNSAAE